LRRARSFQALDDDGRKRLLEGGALESYSPSDVIMKEGEMGDSFFFIKTGAVEVSTQREGTKLKLADLAAGDFFGEVSVITAQPRTATVTALSPVVAVEVPAPENLARADGLSAGHAAAECEDRRPRQRHHSEDPQVAPRSRSSSSACS